MFRRLLLLAALALGPAAWAQSLSSLDDGGASSDPGAGQPAPPPLLGRVEGSLYYSPTGAFRIAIPVLPEVNGTITDTTNVVTFQDPISTHVSVAAFPQDTTQKWKLETQGPRDYLQEFFSTYVWRDFSTNPQARYESNATFNGKLLGGAFFTFITLPGQSAFAFPELRIDFSGPPPVAKRGNLMFVHDNYVYVISMELAERVTQGSLFEKTSQQEDEILHERLIEMANRIQFLKPPAG